MYDPSKGGEVLFDLRLGETSKVGHCRISKVGRLLHKQFTTHGSHDLLR